MDHVDRARTCLPEPLDAMPGLKYVIEAIIHAGEDRLIALLEVETLTQLDRLPNKRVGFMVAPLVQAGLGFIDG
ncbi:hypothetical protein [Glutamicibacter creatinolyticus]|uniref:hypothetical protein n=1 Tax=Glutamicibacter creatinolyticus TaxID=162496 RepID=UPI00338C4946